MKLSKCGINAIGFGADFFVGTCIGGLGGTLVTFGGLFFLSMHGWHLSPSGKS